VRKLAKCAAVVAACVVAPATAFACGFPGRGHHPRPPKPPVSSGTAFSITSMIYASPRCSGSSALLYPGVTRCLVYTVKNDLSVPISVQHITAALDPHSAAPPSGCTASELSLPSFSGSLHVSGGGQANSGGLPIALLDTRTNQDNCENTTLHFVYQGTAVYMATTSTTLTSSLNPSTSGREVTFTAAVHATDDSGSPSGRVNFYACGAAACGSKHLLGSGAVGPHGKASFSTRCLTLGITYVEAVYEGTSTDFSSSTSNIIAQVTRSTTATTSTGLISSPNPSVRGQAVSFTATVASGSRTPTGIVTFSRCPSTSSCVTPAPLGSAALSSGRATFSTSGLSPGTIDVEAAYAGVPGTFASSTSNIVAQVIVAPVKTTTRVTSTPDPSAIGQPVTLEATVTPYSAAETPGGTVSFFAGSPTGTHHLLGTVTLNGNAQALMATPGLPAGIDSYFAVYNASVSFLPSTSSAVTQHVVASTVQCATATFAGYHCLWIGDGSSTVTAGDGNTRVVAGDGTDTFVLGNGNDWVSVGNGSRSQLTLGNGNDTVEFGTGSRNGITLGGGTDTITIAGSDDQIRGGSGNETIYLGSGLDNSYVGGRGHNVCHLPPSPAPYHGSAVAHYRDTVSHCTVVTP
jgi:large repetitive protein